MTKLWGIPNCDTVKKARTWLDKHQVEYQFCDLREQSLTAKQVKTWINAVGLDSLINKRSTTWKKLSDGQRQSLSEKTAATLIIEQPTLIKRPLLETTGGGNKIHRTGFSEADYRAIFA